MSCDVDEAASQTSGGGSRTLGDLFESLEEAGCFSLKVIYSQDGEKIRVDYGLSLSCFNFVNEAALSNRNGYEPLQFPETSSRSLEK